MKEFIVALIIVFAIVVVICLPLAFIWALNTLFPVLSIPFTFKTWVAALFLSSVIGSGAAVKASK